MDYDNRFNTKVKVYPDGNFKTTYCNKCIFSNSNLERISKKRISKKCADSTSTYDDKEMLSISAKELEENGIHTFEEFLSIMKNPKSNNLKKNNFTEVNLNRSLKRAKDKIFDMVYVNDFKYFVTVTFDPKIVNSSNVKTVIKKLRVWLSNQKQRFGMEYILVPEYHESGLIHCHLVITDYPTKFLEHAKKHKKGGEVVYNNDGTPQLMYTSKGQPIYNITNWKYGYSTCIPIYKAVNNSNIKIAHYITKYITKDVHKIFGKFYWSSKGLKRDTDIKLFNSDYDSLPLKEYEVPNTDIRLKYDSQFDFILGGRKHEKK